jgi:hypothetical protein
MKLKEFMKTGHFDAADIVEYLDKSGNNVEPTTEVERRRFRNKSVIEYTTRREQHLQILTITLE